MKRTGALMVLLGAIAAAASAQPAQPGAEGRAAELREQLERDCAGAIEPARALIRSRAFSRVAPAGREQFGFALADCALERDDPALALAAAKLAGSHARELSELVRIQIAIDEERPRDARSALTALTERAPEFAGRLEEESLWTLYFGISALDDAAELLALHDAIVAARLRPRQAGDEAMLRLEHATLLLGAAQLERARERLAGELTASMVVAIRGDKRFDPLRTDAAFEGRLDAHRAAEQDIARARAALESAPRRLEARLELLSALRTAGRPGEVVVEAERARALDAESAGAHFEDRDARWNQLLDHLGGAFYALGRRSEAAKAYREGIAHGEHGGANVSQVINFAIALVDQGDPERALLTLKLVGEPSRYGEMWIAAARACANAQLEDAAELSEALSFLIAHEQENQAARLRGLLCADELELAADLLIRRLADPAERAGALSALHDYQAPELPIAAQRAILLERLREVREREDVQRAVRDVGRIESIPLPSDRLGGI